MSSSSSSHDSSSSEWTSSSSDEEILFNEMDQEVVMFFQCAFNVLNSEDLNDNEDEGTEIRVYDGLSMNFGFKSFRVKVSTLRFRSLGSRVLISGLKLGVKVSSLRF
jgi:hypothetical protein